MTVGSEVWLRYTRLFISDNLDNYILCVKEVIDRDDLSTFDSLNQIYLGSYVHQLLKKEMLNNRK